MLSNFILTFLFPAAICSNFSIAQGDAIDNPEQQIVTESKEDSLYIHSAIFLDIKEALDISIYKRNSTDSNEKIQVIIVRR